MKKLLYSVLLAVSACAPALAQQSPEPAAPPVVPATKAPEPTQTQQTTEKPPVPVTPAMTRGRSEYRVGPEDTVRIDFLGIALDDQPLNRNYTVQSNETIELGSPILDAVKLEGLTPLEIGALLAQLLVDRQFYQAGQVRPSVVMVGYRSFEVQVGGAVRGPGLIRLTGDNNSVNRAISLAGGPATNAGTEVEIVRAAAPGQPAQIEVITFEQLNMNDDPGLRENDRVYVRIGEVFFVNGEVNNKGEKPWKPGMTVGEALALAGGTTPKFSLSRSKIDRPIRDKNGTILRYEKVDKLKKETLILPGDQLTAGRSIL